MVPRKLLNFYVQTRQWVEVRGESMYPSIKDGWRVKISPVGPNNISYGDIAVFSGKSYVCHRVLGWFKNQDKEYFLHMGDNAVMPGLIESKNLIGKVISVYNQDLKKIDIESWRMKYKFIFQFYSKIVIFIYKLLFKIKRTLIGERETFISHHIYNLFWRSSFSVLNSNKRKRLC